MYNKCDVFVCGHKWKCNSTEMDSLFSFHEYYRALHPYVPFHFLYFISVCWCSTVSWMQDRYCTKLYCYWLKNVIKSCLRCLCWCGVQFKTLSRSFLWRFVLAHVPSFRFNVALIGNKLYRNYFREGGDQSQAGNIKPKWKGNVIVVIAMFVCYSSFSFIYVKLIVSVVQLINLAERQQTDY